MRRFFMAVLLLVLSIGGARGSCQDYLVQAFDRLKTVPFRADIVEEGEHGSKLMTTYIRQSAEAIRIETKYKATPTQEDKFLGFVGVDRERWINEGDGWKIWDGNSTRFSNFIINYTNPYIPFSVKRLKDVSCLGSLVRHGSWHSIFELPEGGDNQHYVLYVDNVTGLPESWSIGGQFFSQKVTYRYEAVPAINPPLAK
ncbi:hypothetical protein [Labrys sp. (in: a-proteobacteria)]|uniref:hypothetical protein n=1 Tax=Labrys sp. (in: a-proteobacteria) TaxID=1917972 RepID=UPI0039E3B718